MSDSTLKKLGLAVLETEAAGVEALKSARNDLMFTRMMFALSIWARTRC